VSIRLRMTVLYSAILALTLILFSGVLYVFYAQYTIGLLARDLELAAGRVVGMWSRALASGGRVMGEGMPDAPNMERVWRTWQPSELSELRVRDVMRVLGPDGALVDLPINQDAEGLALSPAGLVQL